MLITLNFHPDLQHLFPKTITLEAVSPLAALRTIAEQHPLKNKIDPVPVKFQEVSSFEALEQQYPTPMTFNIVPTKVETLGGAYVGAGSSDNGWINIVIGIIIIALAVVTAGAAAAAGYAWATSLAVSTGIGLVMTGLMQLLAPDPDEDKNTRSAYFSGKNSTTSADTPIQLAFGKRKIYGHYISLNIDTRNFNGDLDEDSDWFAGKVDDAKPEFHLSNFYGIVRATDENIITQLDNDADKTGSQI